MAYQVEFRPAARRDLKRLTAVVRERLLVRIAELAHMPLPPDVCKLAGTRDLWRVRVGDYRIIYTIQQQQLIVIVVQVGHRREVYRHE